MEAVVEEAAEKGGQDPDIVTAAIIDDVQHIAAAQQASHQLCPWQTLGGLAQLLSDISIEGST